MVSEHLLTHWFAEFVPLECVDGQLVGMAPDDFKADWMREQHASQMAGVCGLEVVVLSPQQVVERYDQDI
jgi:hypothetical protein